MYKDSKEFQFERKKHFEFYLPFYEQRNWQIIQDNIDSGQKNDWDVKLETFVGQFITIDEKARMGEFDDLLVEMIQDVKTESLGWFFSKKDWILYGSWKDIESVYPSSLYLIKSEELKNYICGLDGFIKTCISKKGWGTTWNLSLEWDWLLKENIAKKLL